ncbi:homeobox-domain-containing protein [Athelia psychrophila]|uniref:Homeobox-domain-containing protein n=1 Tax=Athelia psychrophila TaxID=1759441 RepID=A0A166XEX0_9AGAM|nr:homeobox-domain-containing protein [Fibularhizoctonia sp. CBS 109695]
MSSPREGYYGSSAGKTRRSPQGQDSQSGGLFQTGQGGRPVLPPISSGFPTSRSPVPSQHQAYYPQPQRVSPGRSDFNAASYGHQWPSNSNSPPQQHAPAFAYYDQPDTRYTGNPYPSTRASPGLADQHEPRRLPPISIGSSGRRDDDWSSSSYVSGGNHVPFDDEIRSPVAGYPPQYPAYHLNQQQAPYSYSQMPSDNTRNVAFPTGYTQSPQTQMGPPVERATTRAKETHPYARYSGTPQTMAYTAEPVAMPAEEVKKKRKRADAAQLKVLNATYQRTAFPSTEERQSLANELGMPPRSVQIWFQNRRQSDRQTSRQNSTTTGPPAQPIFTDPGVDDRSRGRGYSSVSPPTNAADVPYIPRSSRDPHHRARSQEEDKWTSAGRY